MSSSNPPNGEPLPPKRTSASLAGVTTGLAQLELGKTETDSNLPLTQTGQTLPDLSNHRLSIATEFREIQSAARLAFQYNMTIPDDLGYTETVEQDTSTSPIEQEATPRIADSTVTTNLPSPVKPIVLSSPPSKTVDSIILSAALESTPLPTEFKNDAPNLAMVPMVQTHSEPTKHRPKSNLVSNLVPEQIQTSSSSVADIKTEEVKSSRRISVAPDLRDLQSAAALAFQYNLAAPIDLNYTETNVAQSISSPMHVSIEDPETPRVMTSSTTSDIPILRSASNTVDSIILSAALQSGFPDIGADKRASAVSLPTIQTKVDMPSSRTDRIKTPLPTLDNAPAIPMQTLPPMPSIPPMPPVPPPPSVANISTDISSVNRQSIQLSDRRLTIDPALQQYAHIFAALPSGGASGQPQSPIDITATAHSQPSQSLGLSGGVTAVNQLYQLSNPHIELSASSVVFSGSESSSIPPISPQTIRPAEADTASAITIDQERQLYQIRPVSMAMPRREKVSPSQSRPQSISTMQRPMLPETPPSQAAVLSDSSETNSNPPFSPQTIASVEKDTASAITIEQERQLYQIRPVSMAIPSRQPVVNQFLRPQSVSTMQRPMLPETPPSQAAALSESDDERKGDEGTNTMSSGLTTDQRKGLVDIRPQSVALETRQIINEHPFRPQSIALMQTAQFPGKNQPVTSPQGESNTNSTRINEIPQMPTAHHTDNTAAHRMTIDPNLAQYAQMLYDFQSIPNTPLSPSGTIMQSQIVHNVDSTPLTVSHEPPLVQATNNTLESTIPSDKSDMESGSEQISQDKSLVASPIPEDQIKSAGVRASILNPAALSLAYMEQPDILPSAATPTPTQPTKTVSYTKPDAASNLVPPSHAVTSQSEDLNQDESIVARGTGTVLSDSESIQKTPATAFIQPPNQQEENSSEGSVSEESGDEENKNDTKSFVEGKNEQLNLAPSETHPTMIPPMVQPIPGPPLLIDPNTGQAIQPILIDPRSGQPLPPVMVDPQSGQTMIPILLDPQTGQQIQPLMIHPFTGQPIQPIMVDPKTGQPLQPVPVPQDQFPPEVQITAPPGQDDDSEEGTQSEEDEEEPRAQNLKQEEVDLPQVEEITAPPQPPPVIIARDIRPIANLYSIFSQKFYSCGFVYKKNELNVEGKPLGYQDSSGNRVVADRGGEWSKWWMELWGSVLHLWRVPDEFASFPYAGGLSSDKFLVLELDPPLSLISAIKEHQETPIYINITNAIVELFPQKYAPPQNESKGIVPLPPTPYSSFFGLSNAGSNLLLFATSSPLAANSWVTSIRLVSFEMFKLQEAFTYTLLKREEYRTSWNALKIAPFATFTYRGNVSYEGPLQMRTHFSNQWKEYYVVLTSKVEKDPFGAINKKGLFGKKQKKKPEYDLSKRGIFYFYESKNDFKKGKPPILMLDSVKSASVIWPEKPELVEQNLANMGQLEGTLRPVILSDVGANISKDQSGKDNVSVSGSVRSAGSGNIGTNAGKVESERGLMKFEEGFPAINSLEALYNILEGGTDTRPPPTSVLILAPSGDDLVDWLIAVMGAFSIPADPLRVENEVMVLNGLKDFAAENTLLPTHMPWPTTLYFSVPEVSGLTMLGVDIIETRAEMTHVFDQKVLHAKQGKLRIWCEAVSKGEWERRVLERKAVETRLKQMFKWVEKVQSIMTKNGIVIPERRLEDMMMNRFLEEPQEEASEIKEVENDAIADTVIDSDKNQAKEQIRASIAQRLESSRASRHLSVTMKRNSVRNSILSPGQFIMEALEFVKEIGPTSPIDPDSPNDPSKPAKPTRISRIGNKRKSRRSMIPGPEKTKPRKKRDLLDLVEEEEEEGEGSVSESENSSEGSLSANEESDVEIANNDELPLGTGIAIDPYQVFDEVPDRNSDGDEVEEEDDIFQFYGEKTLLGDLAQGGRARIRGPGPLIQVAGDQPLHLKLAQASNARQAGAKVEPVVMPGSLLDQSAAATGYRGQVIEVDGPLLGNINKKDRRVMLQGGLLGEMSRREEEKEYWKKMGYRGPIRPGFMPPMPGGPPMAGMYPGMPPMPPGHPSGGMYPYPAHPGAAGYPPYGMPPPGGMYGPMSPDDLAEDPVAAHHREMLRLQALEVERAKERQRMAERGLPGTGFEFGMYGGNSQSDASSSGNSSEKRRAILAKLRAEEDSSSVADSSDDENPRRISKYRGNSSGTEDEDNENNSDSGTEESESDEDDAIPVAKAAMQKRLRRHSDSEEEDSEPSSDEDEDEEDEDEETDSSSDEPLGSRAGAPSTMGRSQTSYNNAPPQPPGYYMQPQMPGYYGGMGGHGMYGQPQTQQMAMSGWAQPQMGVYGRPLQSNPARFSDAPMAPLPPGPMMASSSKTIAARRESLEKSKIKKRSSTGKGLIIQPPQRDKSRTAAARTIAPRTSSRISQPLSASINYDSEEGSQSDDSN